HMGMPDYDEFLGFAETYTNVHVDTTMCFVDSFDADESERLRRDLAPRLKDLQAKVLFGADFPNIPHEYAHQIEVLTRLELGDDWMRDVLWHNGARLLRLE
ncbi:MAG TPA: amidohydrolase family protein, partial [Mycobacteriales bacterium]|nr:amidohydrolase family protein [Mycobacteriales bacterium]